METCKNGHPWTPENTITRFILNEKQERRKRRQCRACGVRASNINNFVRLYGLDREDAVRLYDTRPSVCDSCGDSSDKIHYDHEHSTMKHRGWLCNACNQGLGYFKDDPVRLRKAADYIEKHTSV